MLDGHVTRTRTTMELFLVLVSLLFVTRCGKTTAEESAVINMVVREGDDAVLSCSFGSRSTELELFDWKKDGQKEVFMYDRGTHYNNNPTNQDPDFRGRVFHFAQQLDVGNASVVIRPTKVTDSGSYTCDFPFHQPSRRSHIVLVVGEWLKNRPDISGASPEPIVKILAETDKGVQVHCAVKGAFPKPVVQWKDRAGNIVPAEEPQVSERRGSYDVILQTTVTKTDYYQCVATQKEIKHRVYTETLVLVPVPGNRSGWIVVDFWRGFCLLFFWLFFWL
ncbi:butyrophilin subfamily 1 member A1-like isoform X1 [Solea senegalensis]|uniref:Butyrophilin subfamily 1 member A1-like isoform X1 n=1 Tax=Solea senegalensis TaxID=28829 RepID=A0AAV6QTH6_SOLSE|nr:butyrophilin subfamily 1 member A1-like isoform X1 [Solea senegalensis]